METLIKGTIKWFDDPKGFGFIQGDTGVDIFVHYSVISGDGYKTLKQGEEVYFELDLREKGPYATKVVRANQLITKETCESLGLGSLLDYFQTGNGKVKIENGVSAEQLMQLALAAHNC